MNDGDDDFRGAWARAVSDLREVLRSPLDLERVRAYCRANGGHTLAALSDERLLTIVHMARTFDAGYPDAERDESRRWLKDRVVAPDLREAEELRTLARWAVN